MDEINRFVCKTLNTYSDVILVRFARCNGYIMLYSNKNTDLLLIKNLYVDVGP